MVPRLILQGAVLLGATTVFAQNTPTCSLTNKCPEEYPCCSQYGQCGVGAYCLGGCDPRMSFSLDSCVPEPVCVSKTMKMDPADGIVDMKDYLGDPTKADWVSQGQALKNGDDGELLLTMAPNTAGTVLASTVYMWYGNVKAKVKTGRGAGVVTAFILLSDVKDEIDFEWVGTELDIAQTNYYFQGIPDYTRSGNLTGLSNTFDNWHEYEIRWTPDDITWIVDGNEAEARVAKKTDTWNATSNQWDFPQTPSRVQISIWPGGASTNAQGTIDWAGGPIDWNSEDIQKHGYDYAIFSDISIECYQTTSPPGTNSGKSYTYKDAKATNDTVDNGNKPTILKSLLGTGLDMDKEYPSSSASASDVAVIPGLSGGGPGTNGQAAGQANGGGSSSGSASSPATTCAVSDGFSQDCSNSGSSSGTNTNEGVKQERVLGASAFAAVLAVAAMLWI